MVPQDDAGQDSTSGSWSGSADGDEIAPPPPALVAIAEEASAVGTVIKWLFLLGLVAGTALTHEIFGIPLPVPSEMPAQTAIIAGLLVGIGVKLGNGCTSGHGVCGIGLSSARSTLATVVFMLSGIATVYVVRHVLGATL